MVKSLGRNRVISVVIRPELIHVTYSPRGISTKHSQLTTNQHRVHMKLLDPGVKMGVCLFIGQAVGLKILTELLNNDIIGKGWHMKLSTGVLIAGWQTVQYAYNRGRQDASRVDGTDSASGG